MARQVLFLGRHVLRRGNRIGRPSPPILVEVQYEHFVAAPYGPQLCDYDPSNDRLTRVANAAVRNPKPTR